MPRALKLLLLTAALFAGLHAHALARSAQQQPAADAQTTNDIEADKEAERGKRLLAQGDVKEARKELWRALDSRMKAFTLELYTQRKAGAPHDKVEADARRARFAAKTKKLFESTEDFIPVAGNEADIWREWLETLRVYSRVAEDPKFDTTPFNLSALSKPAHVIYKTEPQYTEKARLDHVSGVVRVRALLRADGTVGPVTVIKTLDSGLDKNAVAVARQIRFQPATFDGRPVAQFVILEYNFNTGF